MEIIKRFKVAGHEYIVEHPKAVYSNEDTIFGDHNSIRCRIRVAQTLMDNGEEVTLTDAQIRNTFWHEVFHAFNYYWNNEQNEDLAQTFANFMCEFIETKQ